MNNQPINLLTAPNIHLPLYAPFNIAKRVHQCPHCNCSNDRQYADNPIKSYLKTENYVKNIYFDRVVDRSQNSSRTNSNSHKHNEIEGTNIYHLQRIPFPSSRALSPTNRTPKVNIRFVSPQPTPIHNVILPTNKTSLINNSEEPIKPKVLNKKYKTPTHNNVNKNISSQGQTYAHSGSRHSFINTNRLNPNLSPKLTSPFVFEFTPIKSMINKNVEKERSEIMELKTTEEKMMCEEIDLNYDYLDEVAVSDRTISDDVEFEK